MKVIKRLDEENKLPVKLVGSVTTNDVNKWKSQALELQLKADAFFVVNHNSLKDDGNPVDQLEIGAWYLRNIKKPDCAHEKQFVEEGILAVCDDSGFNQGYEAVKLAWRILKKGEEPANITVNAPPRGPFIVNLERARMLGITIDENAGVEEFIETSLALEKYPEKTK